MNISVVTICFNNLEELLLTINSVDNQVVKPFQHIIINGSTDNQIKDYLSNSFQPVYRLIINELDNGISDAFNKGIKYSNGHVIHLLNSGDVYFDNTVLLKVKEAFECHTNITWLHGCYQQEINGIWITLGKPFKPDQIYRGMCQVGHPTMFVMNQLYQKYGVFDTYKKIAMDYDFLIRIKDEPFLHLKDILVKFQDGGISNLNFNSGLKEVKQSYQKYFGNSLKMSIWQVRVRILNRIINSKLGKRLLSK